MPDKIIFTEAQKTVILEQARSWGSYSGDKYRHEDIDYSDCESEDDREILREYKEDKYMNNCIEEVLSKFPKLHQYRQQIEDAILSY